MLDKRHIEWLFKNFSALVDDKLHTFFAQHNQSKISRTAFIAVIDQLHSHYLQPSLTVMIESTKRTDGTSPTTTPLLDDFVLTAKSYKNAIKKVLKTLHQKYPQQLSLELIYALVSYQRELKGISTCFFSSNDERTHMSRSATQASLSPQHILATLRRQKSKQNMLFSTIATNPIDSLDVSKRAKCILDMPDFSETYLTAPATMDWQTELLPIIQDIMNNWNIFRNGDILAKLIQLYLDSQALITPDAHKHLILSAKRKDGRIIEVKESAIAQYRIALNRRNRFLFHNHENLFTAADNMALISAYFHEIFIWHGDTDNIIYQKYMCCSPDERAEIFNHFPRDSKNVIDSELITKLLTLLSTTNIIPEISAKWLGRLVATYIVIPDAVPLLEATIQPHIEAFIDDVHLDKPFPANLSSFLNEISSRPAAEWVMNIFFKKRQLNHPEVIKFSHATGCEEQYIATYTEPELTQHDQSIESNTRRPITHTNTMLYEHLNSKEDLIHLLVISAQNCRASNFLKISKLLTAHFTYSEIIDLAKQYDVANPKIICSLLNTFKESANRTYHRQLPDFWESAIANTQPLADQALSELVVEICLKMVSLSVNRGQIAGTTISVRQLIIGIQLVPLDSIVALLRGVAQESLAQLTPYIDNEKFCEILSQHLSPMFIIAIAIIYQPQSISFRSVITNALSQIAFDLQDTNTDSTHYKVAINTLLCECPSLYFWCNAIRQPTFAKYIETPALHIILAFDSPQLTQHKWSESASLTNIKRQIFCQQPLFWKDDNSSNLISIISSNDITDLTLLRYIINILFNEIITSASDTATTSDTSALLANTISTTFEHCNTIEKKAATISVIYDILDKNDVPAHLRRRSRALLNPDIIQTYKHSIKNQLTKPILDVLILDRTLLRNNMMLTVLTDANVMLQDQFTPFLYDCWKKWIALYTTEEIVATQIQLKDMLVKIAEKYSFPNADAFTLLMKACPNCPTFLYLPLLQDKLSPAEFADCIIEMSHGGELTLPDTHTIPFTKCCKMEELYQNADTVFERIKMHMEHESLTDDKRDIKPYLQFLCRLYCQITDRLPLSSRQLTRIEKAEWQSFQTLNFSKEDYQKSGRPYSALLLNPKSKFFYSDHNFIYLDCSYVQCYREISTLTQVACKAIRRTGGIVITLGEQQPTQNIVSFYAYSGEKAQIALVFLGPELKRLISLIETNETPNLDEAQSSSTAQLSTVEQPMPNTASATLSLSM